MNPNDLSSPAPMKLPSKSEHRVLVSAILAASILGFVMAVVAPVNGDDASFHLHWIQAFYALLREGILIPKWVPDGFHGFGAPTFYFYPPLTYYVSSLVIWTTHLRSPEVIFNVVGLITTLGSAATCFYLLRRLDASSASAFLGALFYAFAPYRQFDLYTRSSLSQPMGFIFLPLILAGCIEVVRSTRGQTGIDRYRPSILLTISWTGLLLSAFPLSVAAGMTLLVLWFAFREIVTREHLMIMAVSLLIGSGLVAFQYLPSLHFMKLTQVDTYMNVSDGNWVPALLRGTQVRFVVEDMLIYFSEVALLIWYWRSSKRSGTTPVSRAVVVLLAFWIIVSTPYLSSPLWDHVPIFHLLRFHARFNIFVVLTLTVLGFASGNAERFGTPFAQHIIIIWSIIAVLLSITVIFRIQAHPHKTSLWMDPPEYLPSNTVPALSAMDDLFLPHVHDSFFVASPDLSVVESIQLIHKSARNIEWRTMLVTPHVVVLHQFTWPEWKCVLDNHEIHTEIDSIGRVCIPLKPGRYRFSMELRTSDAELAGECISLVSLILILVFGIMGLVAHKASGRSGRV